MEYDNKHTCCKCGGLNEIKIKDTMQDGSIISECETDCKVCGHNDYWAYGLFESKSQQ